LLLVSVAAASYYLATDDATREAFVSPLATPYFALASLGLLVQALGWAWIGFSRRLCWRRLLAVSLGLMFTVGGMTVCREAVRIAALGPDRFQAHFPGHAEAFSKGGVFVFLFFFAANATLIALVFWLVRHRPAVNTDLSQRPNGTN
jgi:hypothetical protein